MSKGKRSINANQKYPVPSDIGMNVAQLNSAGCVWLFGWTQELWLHPLLSRICPILVAPILSNHPDAEDPFSGRMGPTDNVSGGGFPAFLNKKKMMRAFDMDWQESSHLFPFPGWESDGKETN